MRKFISYGKIRKFSDVIEDVRHMTRFIEVVDGEAVYDHTIQLPTLECTLTEKVHGTNVGIGYNTQAGLWVQSRNNVITPLCDNAGSAAFIETHRDFIIKHIEHIAEAYAIDLNTHTILIYGEFAGGNIQQKSALSGLQKQLVLFKDVKVIATDELPNENPKTAWVDARKVLLPEHELIHNVAALNTKYIVIPFDSTRALQGVLTTIETMVEAVEEGSPLGAALSKEGNVGEGYVGTIYYKGELLRFKVKGEAHSKVVKKARVPKQENPVVKDFVDNYGATNSRLEQFYKQLEHTEGQLSEKFISQYIKLVQQDIADEELSKLAELGLELKEVTGAVAKVAVMYFKDRLKQIN